jgi:hypothetical protein
MEDNKVVADESRRAAHQESMKSQVVRDVNADIAQRAEHRTAAEAQQMDKVAERFRGTAIEEVAGTDREVRRARVLARVSQIANYVFYLVYSLLGIRLALALIGARGGSGFVRAIQAVTDPFYFMFRGIVASPTAGGYTLALPIVIAIAFYVLVHVGVRQLLRLIAHRETQI